MKTYAGRVEGSVATFEHTTPIFVIDDLADLRGPATGVATLPLHLDWSASKSYDLSRPMRVRSMYTTVLREAGGESDLAKFLNRSILRREWAALNLPASVRGAWEATHEVLRCR